LGLVRRPMHFAWSSRPRDSCCYLSAVVSEGLLVLCCCLPPATAASPSAAAAASRGIPAAAYGPSGSGTAASRFGSSSAPACCPRPGAAPRPHPDAPACADVCNSLRGAAPALLQQRGEDEQVSGKAAEEEAARRQGMSWQIRTRWSPLPLSACVYRRGGV